MDIWLFVFYSEYILKVKVSPLIEHNGLTKHTNVKYHTKTQVNTYHSLVVKYQQQYVLEVDPCLYSQKLFNMCRSFNLIISSSVLLVNWVLGIV